MNTMTPVGQSTPPLLPVPQNQSPYWTAQAGAVPSAGVYGPYYAPGGFAKKAKPKEPFHATRADAVFSVWSILLGFLFVRWALPMTGWGVAAFTFLLVGSVVLYARAKGIDPDAESWFWMTMILVCSVSAAVWVPGSMVLWRAFLLVGGAVYWCGSLFGSLVLGKTGNWILLDLVNLLAKIPLKNIAVMPLSMLSIKTGENGEKSKTNRINMRVVLAVLFGLLLCVPLLGVLLPLLLSADGGGFAKVLAGLSRLQFGLFKDSFYVYFVQFIFGIPLSVYLFSLVAGCAHKRYINGMDVKKAQRNLGVARLVPHLSTLVVLGAMCLLYVVFIGCQVPYYFSAFTGVRPEGYEVYSLYAREGFFELCRVVGINLGVLGAVAVLCRKSVADSKWLRVLVVVLAGLTLLLVATAFSKMMLYVGAYGLSALRLKTSVFMVWLACLCGAVVILQVKRFSIVRFGVLAGGVLLCALCLVNVDGLAAQYNATRYLAGTLPTFDASVMEVGDIQSVDAGLRVYGQVDEATQDEITWQLSYSSDNAQWVEGRHEDTLSATLTRYLNLPVFLEEEHSERFEEGRME